MEGKNGDEEKARDIISAANASDVSHATGSGRWRKAWLRDSEGSGAADGRSSALERGTLYGNLARLESAGLIVESDERPAIGLDDERRRYYRLTDFGREVAIAEAERMDAALSQARAKKLFRKPRLA